MASTKIIIMLAIFAVVSPSIVSATEYTVGDGSGWGPNFDYQAWAKDKMFYVGDTLVFKYPTPKHNVYKVNATGFQDCTFPAGTVGLATGNDVITLATPGKKWYICGKPNHCTGLGMKLAVTVWDGAAPAPAPGTSSAPSMLSSCFHVIGAVFVAAAAMVVA